MEKTWGYLRETAMAAQKAGVDPETGLQRTGLDEYLEVIFPDIHDWVHDKTVGRRLDGKNLRTRPDYRSDCLGMIVEFDGLPHYTNPYVILHDRLNTANYERIGYRVVRVPYFIQLTNDAVATLFGVTIERMLFDGKYPSLGKSKGSPAYLSQSGLERMARDFVRFPDQYQVNIKALKAYDDDFMTGASLLEAAYKRQLAEAKRRGILAGGVINRKIDR